MCTHGRSEYEECDKCLVMNTVDGVLDEVKSAIMTENVNLKRKLDQAVALIKDFPGHQNETEWNVWLFKRDAFLNL